MGINPVLEDPVTTTMAPQSTRRVLWRMKGSRRVISAVLRQDPSVGHELIVAFEDQPGDVIETQVEPTESRALEQRADALREVLRAKGLTPIDVP